MGVIVELLLSGLGSAKTFLSQFTAKQIAIGVFVLGLACYIFYLHYEINSKTKTITTLNDVVVTLNTKIASLDTAIDIQNQSIESWTTAGQILSQKLDEVQKENERLSGLLDNREKYIENAVLPAGCEDDLVWEQQQVLKIEQQWVVPDLPPKPATKK